MRHQLVFKVFAAVLIAAGYLIRYWMNARKFRRRNMAGLPAFPSYFRSVITRFFESVLLIVGGVVIFLGIVLFCWTML